MKNISLTIAYDGTDYHGFQRQPNQKTIQGTIEQVLNQVTEEPIQIVASGRTDRGVHAKGQVCHFHTSSQIPADHFARILRHQLPPDILVISSKEVGDHFHAQYDAQWKTYRYQIETAAIPSVFERRYFTHLPYSLSIEPMREAAKQLLGTHDFTSFCSAKTYVVDRVRTLYDCRIEAKLQKVFIEVTANGFLYNMVRILVGTLVEIGRGRNSAEQIPLILQKKDRRWAGPTLSPEGLMLLCVGYQPWHSSACSSSMETT